MFNARKLIKIIKERLRITAMQCVQFSRSELASVRDCNRFKAFLIKSEKVFSDKTERSQTLLKSPKTHHHCRQAQKCRSPNVVFMWKPPDRNRLKSFLTSCVSDPSASRMNSAKRNSWSSRAGFTWKLPPSCLFRFWFTVPFHMLCESTNLEMLTPARFYVHKKN